MPDRFYCEAPPEDGRLVLEGDEARHLGRVLRAKAGDRVEVFDGRGCRFLAEIEEIGKRDVRLQVIEGLTVEPPPACRLTLATAVPKGDRFDWLIEKATEIGVDRLIPISTERSVVDPGGPKLERLRKKVVEASKQSGRSRLMELGPPRSLADVLSDGSWPSRWIAQLGGADLPRGAIAGPAAIAIGPEGGFTDAEVESARDAGWSAFGLGPTRLRVETAGLVASSLILASSRGGAP